MTKIGTQCVPMSADIWIESGRAKCGRSKFIRQCNLRYETKIETKLMYKNKNAIHRCMPFGLQTKLCKYVMIIIHANTVLRYTKILEQKLAHLMWWRQKSYYKMYVITSMAATAVLRDKWETLTK